VPQITYILVADGGTDRVLIPIINWAIHRLDPEAEILEPDFVKRRGPVGEFLNSLETGAMVVFVHRDAETEDSLTRLFEFANVDDERVVPVIPVRMTEAWLLCSSSAIASAAGRPKAEVLLPALASVESLPDPKAHLEELIIHAAGAPTGRRGKQLRASIIERRVSVAERIADYSPLEALPSFTDFQQRLASAYPYGRS